MVVDSRLLHRSLLPSSRARRSEFPLRVEGKRPEYAQREATQRAGASLTANQACLYYVQGYRYWAKIAIRRVFTPKPIITPEAMMYCFWIRPIVIPRGHPRW